MATSTEVTEEITDVVRSQSEITDVQSEMFDVAEATREGGVMAVCTDISESAGEISVEYELPTGTHITATYEKPQRDSREYEFVRFVEENGGSLTAFEHLVGEDILVHRTDVANSTVWKPVIPADKTLRERFFDRVSVPPSEESLWTSICIWPLLMVFSPLVTFDDDLDDGIRKTAGAVLLTALWIAIPLLILLGMILW